MEIIEILMEYGASRKMNRGSIVVALDYVCVCVHDYKFVRRLTS